MDPLRQHILVVDDDPDQLSTMCELLRGGGFDAEGVPNGARMRDALACGPCDLVLLDLRLQSEDGMSIARELRRTSSLPIVMVSGASDDLDRILLLELAADDFITKPFIPRELLARVRAVLRRTRVLVESAASEPSSPPPPPPPSAAGPVLRFGTWELRLGARELVDQRGIPCELTQGEFRLLEALMKQPHRVWTRDQLIEQTRSLEAEVFDRTIDVLILRLRRKIEPNPKHPQYICTERGLGYVFAAKVTPG